MANCCPLSAGSPSRAIPEPQQYRDHSCRRIFKLLVINNQTAEVAAFADFENIFQFGRLVSAMALAIGHEPEGDFAAASRHLMNTTTVQQLLVLSQLDTTDPLKV
jgi:hypothetical protein